MSKMANDNASSLCTTGNGRWNLCALRYTYSSYTMPIHIHTLYFAHYEQNEHTRNHMSSMKVKYLSNSFAMQDKDEELDGH